MNQSHQKILENPSKALEAAARFRSEMEARNCDLLPWSGWPLRPFFFNADSMRSLTSKLVQAIRDWAHSSAEKSPATLATELGLDSEVLKHLDYKEAFTDSRFTGFLRPDGFLRQDRYVVGELNFGNGLLVSMAYADLLAEYHARDANAQSQVEILRPFDSYLNFLATLLPEPPRLVGILACADEYQTIMSWQKRVGDMVALGREYFHRRGWDTVLLHEDDVVVPSAGKARTAQGNKELDLIVPLTINTTFFDEPELLQSKYQHWTGSKVGETPFFSPLSALCLDKGTLPWLSEFVGVESNEFRIDIPETEIPSEARAREYRLNKDEWVLKRAFDGKDTHVGCSTYGRPWNAVLKRALENGGYVMQKYQRMPTTVVPITPDGQSIEWVEVSFELSPFLVDDRFAGGIVRYAPKAEGLIMSPPPENMGLGIALAV